MAITPHMGAKQNWENIPQSTCYTLQPQKQCIVAARTCAPMPSDEACLHNKTSEDQREIVSSLHVVRTFDVMSLQPLQPSIMRQQNTIRKTIPWSTCHTLQTQKQCRNTVTTHTCARMPSDEICLHIKTSEDQRETVSSLHMCPTFSIIAVTTGTTPHALPPSMYHRSKPQKQCKDVQARCNCTHVRTDAIR